MFADGQCHEFDPKDPEAFFSKPPGPDSFVSPEPPQATRTFSLSPPGVVVVFVVTAVHHVQFLDLPSGEEDSPETLVAVVTSEVNSGDSSNALVVVRATKNEHLLLPLPPSPSAVSITKVAFW